MIYTRFGTRIELLHPVNWDTGWVDVIAHYNQEQKAKEFHISDLKADGGLNEIQAASDLLESNETTEIYFCRDCNLPMETLEQEQRQAPPLKIITCKNKSCALWSVTLTTTKYSELTEVEWQTYRESVARLKKTLEME